MNCNSGAIHDTCHYDCFLGIWPPIHGVYYWERAPLVYMVWVFLWTTGIVIWTVKVQLWIIYCDSSISSSVCITFGSSGMWWILMQGFLSWHVSWLRMWSAAISWVSWWAPCVKMTFYVECDGANSVYKCLSVGTMNYSCDVICCPYGVT